MKLINWWIDRYSIGGLFIASIVCGIMGIVMICHIFFDFTLSDKIGRLALEYKSGIAIPVKFSSSPGGDTSILIREKQHGHSESHTVFRPDDNGKWKPVEGSLQSDLSSRQVFYRDTIFPDYQTTNERPPWKDNWSVVTKVEFEQGVVYIKPTSFYNRTLLLAPQIFFLLVISYFFWQLAFFLDNIQTGQMFSYNNYCRIRNMGIGVLIYQLLLFIIYLLENTYHVRIEYRSTIANYRSPISLFAEADYHLGWAYLIAGCILLIVAKAFHKGYTLQQEQDLTI